MNDNGALGSERLAGTAAEAAQPERDVRGLKTIQAVLRLSSMGVLTRLLEDRSNGLHALLQHEMRTGETTAVKSELLAWGAVHLKPVPYSEYLERKRARRRARENVAA